MARDQQHWGKDPRDRRRFERRHRHTGGHAPGTVAGARGTVAAVREVRDERGAVREVVTEDRYSLAVPAGLKDRVRSLFVKVNSVAEAGDASRGRFRSRVLVVTFHEPQSGIRGLVVSRAEERKLQKLGFTHATIQWIPPEVRDEAAGPRPAGPYDERAFRIAWWKPRGGHQHAGDKGGEVVHEVHDELSVLQWIYENDLLALYEVPHLVGQGLLPKRDDDREVENGVAAQMQAFFGRPMRPVHSPETFHFSRVVARVLAITGGDSVTALEYAAQTQRGQRLAARVAFDTFGLQTFYVSAALGLAYAVFHLPGARFVLRVDLRARTAMVEPMRVDRHGMDEMLAYHRFLTDAAFRCVDWPTFQAIAGGIGTALQPPTP